MSNIFCYSICWHLHNLFFISITPLTIVISIERMYSWCLNNDIIPDYIVVLDACDDVNESFDTIHSDTIHLVATQCRTDTIELLKKHKCYIYSTPQFGVDQHNYWAKNDYSRVTIINGGGSVSLQAIAIAMTLGCKDISMFGFDCHITDKSYAKGITGVGDVKKAFGIRIDDQNYVTTSAYFSFAQQFFVLYDTAKQSNMLDKVVIYGDSLVKTMSVENIFNG